MTLTKSRFLFLKNWVLRKWVLARWASAEPTPFCLIMMSRHRTGVLGRDQNFVEHLLDLEDKRQDSVVAAHPHLVSVTLLRIVSESRYAVNPTGSLFSPTAEFPSSSVHHRSPRIPSRTFTGSLHVWKSQCPWQWPFKRLISSKTPTYYSQAQQTCGEKTLTKTKIFYKDVPKKQRS